jgi:hypothetical protein
MTAVRLISRVDVLEQLLAAVAAVPEAVKLSIPALRDSLVSQADVLAGLETLVAAGELDRSTLRPASVGDTSPTNRALPPVDEAIPAASEAPRKPGDRRRIDDVSAAVIADEIREFLRLTGMKPARFGREALRDPKFVAELPRRSAVRGPTAAKIRAFIADRSAPPPIVTKLPLGRKSRPYCAQPSNCTAPPRGPCSRCQKGSIDQARRARFATEVEKVANGESKGFVRPAVRAAAAQLQSTRAAQERQGDHVEQAKLALQRRGLSVYSASIHGGRSDCFMVSGQRDPQTGRLKELTPGELLDVAEKVTGQSFRRVA